jgi:hypothetical protein
VRIVFNLKILDPVGYCLNSPVNALILKPQPSLQLPGTRMLYCLKQQTIFLVGPGIMPPIFTLIHNYLLIYCPGIVSLFVSEVFNISHYPPSNTIAGFMPVQNTVPLILQILFHRTPPDIKKPWIPQGWIDPNSKTYCQPRRADARF